MSSGRIGMILTYTRNKNKNDSNASASASANAFTVSRTVPTVPTIIKPSNPLKRINRFPNISMSDIIHKPGSGCSSCGN
jgi:hypothetical protein